MIQYYVACTSCGGRGFTPAPMPVGDGARALARAEIILEATSVVYGVPIDMIRSKSQKAYVVEARDEACYRIRQETDLTLGAIARAVGRTDHSTPRRPPRRIAGLFAFGEDAMNTARDLSGEAPESSWQPVQLRYCGRCGALCVLPEEGFDSFCPACVRALHWLYGEVGNAARKR